jgi:hypothetical protein
MSSDYNLRAGLGPYRHGVLNDGAQKEIHVVNMRAPFTVWVEPTGGDEVTVWVKNAADATPQEWPDGPVTDATTGVVFGPVFSFIFQRTGGSGTTSKFGVNI